MGSDKDEPRRRRWWVIGLALLVATAAGGWFVGSRLQSPEQAASNAAPPPASWITAAVERRVLSQTVITRGDVRPQVTVVVAAPSSVEGSPVVTAIGAAPGDEVVEGARLVEVSGRPVFVMLGDVPVYRSLRPGMSGADVAQLQAALARLGFEPDTDGVFGEATKSAVTGFYERAGYVPVPSSATEAADRAAAEQALSDAEAAVIVAQAALDAAGDGQPQSAVAQAEAAVNQADRALETARADRVSQVALAEQSLNLAIAERDRVAADPEAAPGMLDQAQLAVNQAQSQLDQTRRSTQDAVEAAEEALWIAALALNEATKGTAGTEAQAQLDTAVATRDRARTALDTIVAAAGPTVAQGEVVFAPTLPARVQHAVTTLGASDAGEVGDTTGPSSGTQALVTLAGGDLVVAMTLRPGEVGLVRAGMPVEVLDEQSNTTYPATVREIAETPSVGADGQSGLPVVLEADETLPDTLAGANLRVTITAASTETATLVVPLAAVSSAGDGSTYVSVVPPTTVVVDDDDDGDGDGDGNGEPVVVPVTTGLSADGFVAVEPVAAGALSEGDRVIVGR